MWDAYRGGCPTSRETTYGRFSTVNQKYASVREVIFSVINQQRGTEVLLCWLIPQTSNHRISARVFQSKSVVSRRSREALAIVGVIRYTSDTAHEGYERHATPEYEQSALHEQQTIGRRPPCPLLVAGLGTRVFRVVTSSKAILSDYK